MNSDICISDSVHSLKKVPLNTARFNSEMCLCVNHR